MAQPLTRHSKKTGQPYVRPAAVEAAIDRAIGERPDEVRRRALIRDKDSPDFLPSECLLHLIRKARHGGDQETMSALAGLLLTRCEANLRVTIAEHGVANAQALREDILQHFGLMLAEDGTGAEPDILDFFECRFHAAFRSLRVQFYRREVGQQNRIAAPPEPENGEPDPYDDAFAPVSEALRSPADQENALYLKEVAKVIDGLPPDEKEAVVLCRVLGYQDESEYDGVVTAATLTGNTGRTIRNRLGRAAKKLSRLKEDL